MVGTHAAMSNKFPMSCTKKTSIETRQVEKFTRGKCEPLVAQAFNPPHVANWKNTPGYIVQAAFNKK